MPLKSINSAPPQKFCSFFLDAFIVPWTFLVLFNHPINIQHRQKKKNYKVDCLESQKKNKKKNKLIFNFNDAQIILLAIVSLTVKKCWNAKMAEHRSGRFISKRGSLVQKQSLAFN